MYGKNHPCYRPEEDRFWEKVDRSGECWNWTACRSTLGYGWFYPYRTKATPSHRWAWSYVHGPVPLGMSVLHRCDNRRCVNPAHLFLGNQRDNVLDMERKGRSRHPVGESHGMAKTTVRTVLKIRRLYEGGGWSHRLLALKFGMAKNQIASLVNRKTWRHV